ncbi:phosphatase PAP2 family protein [Patescibacteria group bacterium]|nr:phosphatase PAP2 family protein [Patescibacteria group bacterium]
MVHGLSGRALLVDWIGIFCANYLPYILVAVALLAVVILYADWKKRFTAYAFMALSIIMARGLVTEIIHFFYQHPRPFVTLQFTPLVPESGSSFPSGHTTLFFALALVMWYFNKKLGWYFIAGATIIGIARVFVGVHWPLDILGGVVLGLLSTWLVKLLFDKSNIEIKRVV